jgi:hypothetical protein
VCKKEAPGFLRPGPCAYVEVAEWRSVRPWRVEQTAASLATERSNAKDAANAAANAAADLVRRCRLKPAESRVESEMVS